jgi:hypothetical protein
MTKGKLLRMLQEDKKPMDTEVQIYLQCTNDDKGILGNVTDVEWSKTFKSLILNGEYEESEY